MNNMDSIRESALGFVETASKACAQSDMKSKDNLETLISEVANATESLNQNSTVQTCSSTVTKAIKAVDMARWKIQSSDLEKLNDSLSNLTKIAISAVRQDLLERKRDEPWLLDFLSLDDCIIGKLVADPVFLERLDQAVNEAGPNLLTKPDMRLNLLMALILQKHPKLQELALKLLEHPDVDLLFQTKNGFTTLHVAAMPRNEKLVETLLVKGADPYLTNQRGEIPLDVCNNSDGIRTLLKAMKLEVKINGEAIADKVVKKIPNTFFLENTLDMDPLVDYLKENSLSSDTLDALNKALKDGQGDIFVIKLLEKGVILEGLSDVGLGDVAHLCISKGEPEPLRTLLQARYLPIMPPAYKQDLFTTIQQHEKLSKELKADIVKYKEAMGEAAIQAYYTLSRDLESLRDPIRRAVNMEAIDREFQTLIDLGFKGAATAKAEFDALESTTLQHRWLSQAQDIIGKKTTVEVKVQEAIDAGKEVFQVLRTLAWLANDDLLLAEIGRLGVWFDGDLYDKGETGAVDKIVVNIALDKAFFKDKEVYEGGSQYWVAPYLSNGLTAARARIEKDLITIQEATVEKSLQIVDQCRRELTQMVRWADSFEFSIALGKDYESNNLMRSEALIQTINRLSRGESCLIPVTVPGHATLIRVERGNQNKVRLFMYNTGLGVGKYHAKGEQKGSFQTYLEYSDVPLEELQNPQDWTDFIQKLSRTVQSMDDVYVRLDKMCGRGIKNPPSKSDEAYEAVQASGSCAYMCFLAMIRQRFVSSIEDPAEGLGLYKYVKAELMHGIEERTRALRSEKINDLFQTKLRLMGIEIALTQALADSIERKKIISSLFDSLSKNQLYAWVDELNLADTMTPLKLYAFIHRAIRKISESKHPSSDHKLLNEAILARRARQNQNEQGYIEILDEFFDNPTSINVERWAKAFGAQLLGGSKQSTALDWAVKRLAVPPKSEQDDSTSSRLLLRLVKGIKRLDKEKKEELLGLLVQRYQANDNSEMVEYLNTARRAEPTQQVAAAEFEY